MTTLTFDDQGFGMGEQRISWSDLCVVGLRTTADGPLGEDVFWLFLTATKAIEVAGSAIGGVELAALQARLPGFANEKLIDAMGSTEERMFRLWHDQAETAGWEDARARERFRRLVERLGADDARATAVFDELAAAWAGPGRRYHDREHLAECLHHLDLARAEVPGADLAELALWFHDAVYVAGASDNEARSAQRLLEASEHLGIERVHAERAAALVRATAHQSDVQVAPDSLEALVLDVDLAILGSDPVRFMEYEHAIAEEFAEVPAFRFQLGRGRFLSSVLARPFIYRTAFFRARCETRARAQLSSLLASPRYRVFRMTRWLSRPVALAGLKRR